VLDVAELSWKSGQGLLRKARFASDTSVDVDQTALRPSLLLSGGVIDCWRSPTAMSREVDWTDMDSVWMEKMGASTWERPGYSGLPHHFRLRSHCFRLRCGRDGAMKDIGIALFDDLSKSPETFNCLLVADQKLEEQEIERYKAAATAAGTLIAGSRRMWRGEHPRRYWLLILEHDSQSPSTYHRLGVAIAFYDGVGHVGVPLHKMAKRTDLTLA
jgi:hypothetical protein